VSTWRICIGALVLIPLCFKKSRLLVVVIAIFVGATAMSIRQSSLERSEIAHHFNSSIDFSAQIITDPMATSTGKYSFTARLIEFTVDRKVFHLRVPVRVISRNPSNVLPGQMIAGNARVIESSESRVSALLLVDKEIAVTTMPSRWAAALGSIRSGLRNHSGEGDAGALIPGMVLGDTSKQTADFKDAMKRSGLTHLVLSLIHI
jgi:competence protein ComEC